MMKVSEITADTLKEWLGISDGEEEALAAVLSSALKTAQSFTGLSLEELDEHEEITIAILGICNDYYNGNRPQAANTNMNKMSESILAMHSKNYL